MRLILIFSILFASLGLKAQNFHEIEIQLDTPSTYLSDLPLFSSIKVSSDVELELTLMMKDETHVVTISDHEHIEFPSSFIILNSPTNELEIMADTPAKLRLELFYAEPIVLPSVLNSELLKKKECDKPESIDQSVWRQGLPDPKVGRTATTVKHCIIHHAASSNANTDYTAVVRNIYLLHTQSNGWDDIGYNFLIAPNGQVYDGRDDQDIADEDNIQGAHFCSKNSGTMGICLIGDYSALAPNDSMIESLHQLLAWKLNKENIAANDSFRHPDGLSEYLPAIAMHRLGCNTQCPGDSVAIRLPQIRTAVAEILENCAPSVSINEPPIHELKIYPNPSFGAFSVHVSEKMHFSLTNFYGQEISDGILKPGTNKLYTKYKGLIVITLTDDLGNKYSSKILIID